MGAQSASWLTVRKWFENGILGLLSLFLFFCSAFYFVLSIIRAGAVCFVFVGPLFPRHFCFVLVPLLGVGAGSFDWADAGWIVIRGPLWGRDDMPFGRPTGRPRVGHPQSVFWCFWLLLIGGVVS
jgi:O-antigen ligase